MRTEGSKNLTYTQRLQIEPLVNMKGKKKLTKQEIADIVGINVRTLYKELKRGTYEHTTVVKNFWKGDKKKVEERYSADIAQRNYEMACTKKGRPLKIGNDYELIKYIDERVAKEKISPRAVLGQIKKMGLQFKTDISTTTLYRYIRLGFFEHIQATPHKHKHKRETMKMKRPPRGTSIERRPESINLRSTFGHWEMDCICGPNKAAFLVLIERYTRKAIIFKLENKRSSSVIECLDILERKYGAQFKEIFKSITMDNGSEFSRFKEIERSIYEGLRTRAYYCHPYCASERGTVERMNREIRRLVPKGTRLNKFTEEEVQQIEDWLNNYPREVLGYATSNEVFTECLQAITTAAG